MTFPVVHAMECKQQPGGLWEATIFPTPFAQADERPMSFTGTYDECQMFLRFPAYASTPGGMALITRYAEDQALAAWDEFCAGGE